MNDQTYVVKQYKDTVFRLLFKDKLLELYNAVNNSQHSDPEELEVVTLENAVFMSIKNDVSCLLDMRIQLYEQQSTVNPNMPLRDLVYVCAQYEKLIVDENLYSRKLIKLPTPRFIVFYNGTEKQPERRDMYLSDSFEIQEEKPSLELRVTQFNINPGYNVTLLNNCPTLFQYMQYVDQVRQFRIKYPLKKAVPMAVDYCIEHGILRDFLLANKAEVIKMSIFEYDEERHKKFIREEGYEDGFSAGHSQGISQGIKAMILENLEENVPTERILEKIQKHFHLTEEDAETYFEKYASRL
ncbi:MAG: hypothetical protein ACI39H_04570 [Lachnospiraceae bacterium]